MGEVMEEDKSKEMMERYVSEALAAYHMQDCKAVFIRHNENLTYKIEDRRNGEERDYLLRIHHHRDGFTTDPVYVGMEDVTLELRNTELKLIEHLNQCGMNNQVPVRNIKGELVTCLEDQTLVTMLTWLPGRIVEKTNLSPELCYKMGEMVYQLHTATRSFLNIESNAKLPALRYDTALCNRMIEKFRQLDENRVLDRHYIDVMITSLEIIGKIFQEKENEFIPVHADLSLSNQLITDTGLVPIDFSLFGYGHPMMDLGCLVSCFSGAIHRQSLEEGYHSSGEKIDYAALDCSFALNVILGVNLHCESWTKETWFQERLPVWCRDIFQPFNERYATDHSSTGRMLNTKVTAVCAEEKDIPAWLSLVELLKDQFPGLEMEDYTKTLKRNIERKSALCVREDGKLAGVLLFSNRHHCLSCMAVHPAYRRHKVATVLIQKMMLSMPDGNISVTTYRENDSLGVAPRALYQKLGFQPMELLTEFDYPVQRFVLVREK